MRKYLLVITPLLFFFYSCISQSKEKTLEERIIDIGTKNMNEGKSKYSIFVPENWTTEQKKIGGIDYYFLLAPKTKEDPNTNVNIITENMRDMDLYTFRKGAIKSLLKTIPSVNITDTGSIRSDTGLLGVWYTYTFSEEDTEAKLKSFFYSKDRIAYVITAGTIKQNFDKYLELIDKIGSSFKFEE